MSGVRHTQGQNSIGDLAVAVAACESSLELARASGTTETMALALHNLVCFTRMQGYLEAASRHAEEARAYLTQRH